MFHVYHHWDPLRVCLVGRSYPPAFYHWIKDSKTRNRFEKLSQETEEDFQNLVRLLEKFQVEVIRPDLPHDWSDLYVANRWVQPPVSPRDYFIMIHDTWYVPRVPNRHHAWHVFYRQYKQPDWPFFDCPKDFFDTMPAAITTDGRARFEKFQQCDQSHLNSKLKFYSKTFDRIKQQGNKFVYTELDFLNGCFVTRCGNDLYFATQNDNEDHEKILGKVETLFPDTHNRIVDAKGHGDAVYCPIAPGLIVSLNDVQTYQDTFPGWEVVYLPSSGYATDNRFETSMKLNKGRWFLEGFDQDPNLIELVDHYFDQWLGNASETAFYINILMIDRKNVVVSQHNDLLEKTCARHGIEVHVVPFRHQFFWDSGIHCITNDIHRDR